MLPIEMLNAILVSMGWRPCVPSELRAALPEFPPAVLAVPKKTGAPMKTEGPATSIALRHAR